MAFCTTPHTSYRPHILLCSFTSLRIQIYGTHLKKSISSTSIFYPSPDYAFLKSCCRSISAATSTTDSTCTFTWDDVVQVSQPDYIPHDSSELSGFLDKVKLCNRGAEKQSEFYPFVVDGHIVGYVHHCFVDYLRDYQNVFVLPQRKSNSNLGGDHVTLSPDLNTPEDRTRAVAEAVKSLGEDLIPGIRNELYPVTSYYGAPIFFSLERAAAPYFGIKAYGVHMNGFVEKDEQQLLWIGKRSQAKPTYPGMLDHLVAGGLPHGISCGENLVKECEEEAAIPRSISMGAKSVGAVSYMDIDGHRYKRDVLFCYDLQLPNNFAPKNQDGEVDEFKLVPVTHVANIIKRTHFFKPNCSLVIIDFLFRHGYIGPESLGYLELLQSLRMGGCS